MNLHRECITATALGDHIGLLMPTTHRAQGGRP